MRGRGKHGRIAAGLGGLVLVVAGLALAGPARSGGVPGADAPPPATAGPVADPDQARSDYFENCGGCHGIQGQSAPAQLPELRDRVGWLMCTPESRAYLLRLPNVAHSRITDNAQLADLMNFVIFTLGGHSAPPGTRPFTAEEVARERKFALTNASLVYERAVHVEQAIHKCHAPASLRQFYPGAKG